MRAYRTVIAAAVFGLMILLYIGDLMRDEQQEYKNLEAKKIVSFREQDVTSFTLVNETLTYPRMQVHMAFERKPGGWWMRRPHAGWANHAGVEAMLSNLAGAVKHHKFPIDEGNDLSLYGLDQPVISLTVEGTIEFRTPQGPEYESAIESLMIGSPSTTGQYYAQSPGESVCFVVSEHLRNQLSRSAEELRSWNILHANFDGVQAITAENRAGSFRVRQQADGEWEVIQGERTFRGDREMVQDFIRVLADAEIFSNREKVSDGLEQLALVEPLARLEVESTLPGQGRDDRQRSALFVGRNEPSLNAYYAKNESSDEVFLLKAPFVEEVILAMQAKDFRYKKIFEIDPNQIMELDVKIGQVQMQLLRREDGSWGWKNNPRAPVRHDVVQEFANDLASASAYYFIDDDPSSKTLEKYGLLSPRREFFFTVQPPNELPKRYSLSVGDYFEDSGDGGGQICARSDQGASVFTLKGEKPNYLFLIPSQVRDARLIPGVENWSPTQIEVTHEGRSLTAKKDETGLMPVTNKAGQDKGIMSETEIFNFLQMLEGLKSVEILEADADEIPKSGLDKPVTTVTLWINAQDSKSPSLQMELGPLEKASGSTTSILIRVNGRYATIDRDIGAKYLLAFIEDMLQKDRIGKIGAPGQE